MATVLFREGYSWDNLPGAKVNRMISLEKAVSRLATLRAEWQEAAQADDQPLTEVRVNLVSLLVDFCDLLELTVDEQTKVFGLELMEATSLTI